MDWCLFDGDVRVKDDSAASCLSEGGVGVNGNIVDWCLFDEFLDYSDDIGDSCLFQRVVRF